MTATLSILKKMTIESDIIHVICVGWDPKIATSHDLQKPRQKGINRRKKNAT